MTTCKNCEHECNTNPTMIGFHKENRRKELTDDWECKECFELGNKCASPQPKDNEVKNETNKTT